MGLGGPGALVTQSTGECDLSAGAGLLGERHERRAP